MRATFKFTTYFLAILLLGLASCNKDEFKESSPAIDLFPNKAESVNEVRSLFAQTLAKALQNEQLLHYFHEKMQKAYASDYEWVYLAEKDQIVYDNKRVADILKEYGDPELLKRYGENFFDVLTETSPLLAVSMPDLDAFNATTWDKNFIPDVVSVLDGIDYTYNIYKKNGTTSFYLRNEIEAIIQDPVLSVWDAEAYYLIKEDGTTSWGQHIDAYMPSIAEAKTCYPEVKPLLSRFPSYLFSQKTYYLVEHNALLQLYSDCLGLTSEEPIISPKSGACARDSESADERMAEFKINDWGVFTNIRNQFLESKYVFHGDVAFATRNSFGTVSAGTSKYVSSSLKKGDLLDCSGSAPCRGRFITANYRIWTDWDQEEFGSPYKVAWAEVDNGTTTVSLNLSFLAKFAVKLSNNTTGEISAGVTAGISRTGAAIVLLGDAPVFYCDPILDNNNTGSITYRSN